MWSQIFRLTIRLMAARLTWYFFASSSQDGFPRAHKALGGPYSNRMEITSLLVSLEYPLDSPCVGRPLPLRSRSLLLSDGVPKKRCFGFRHLGLSQVCKTHKPFGMFPSFIKKYARAALWPFRCNLNNPYPSRSHPPVQSQQSYLFPIFTLFQNLFHELVNGSLMPRRLFGFLFMSVL